MHVSPRLHAGTCTLSYAPIRISPSDAGHIFSFDAGPHSLLSACFRHVDGAHLGIDLLVATALWTARRGTYLRFIRTGWRVGNCGRALRPGSRGPYTALCTRRRTQTLDSRVYRVGLWHIAQNLSTPASPGFVY